MEYKSSLLRNTKGKFQDRQVRTMNNITIQDLKRLFEDLHVRQMGLSVQNEELCRIQRELKASRDWHTALYEFAPIGYVINSKRGFIIQTNFICAEILGVESHSLIGKPFSQFVHKHDKDLYYFNQKSLLKTNTKQICVLKLVRKGGVEFKAQLESIVVKDIRTNIPQILTTITDIHEQKMMIDKLQKAHSNLARKIKARTAKLNRTNQELKRNIEEHKRTEEKLRDSENRLLVLSRKIIESQENDRKHVAKELHDSVAGNLAAIKLSLEQRLSLMKEPPQDDIYSLELVIADIRDTIEEVRRISNHLMPFVLVDLGLVKTIQWFCREQSNYHSKTQITATLKIQENRLHELLKITIFRVIQEAVNNALRHGAPDLIRLDLVEIGDYLELLVTDNGCGFDSKNMLSNPDSLNGFGLRGMRNRAEICNGRIEISSTIGKGTQVRLSLPFRPQKHRPGTAVHG